RYVVVSTDEWNSASKVPLVVRTTTQLKSFEEFPAINYGRAQACCPEISAVRTARVDRKRRPSPSRLPVSEMAAVANGSAVALDLQPDPWSWAAIHQP